MRPAFSRAHGKLENFRVVETRRDVTTFSLETLRVANHQNGVSKLHIRLLSFLYTQFTALGKHYRRPGYAKNVRIKHETSVHVL